MDENQNKKVNFMDELVKKKISQLQTANLIVNDYNPELNDYGIDSLDHQEEKIDIIDVINNEEEPKVANCGQQQSLEDKIMTKIISIKSSLKNQPLDQIIEVEDS